MLFALRDNFSDEKFSIQREDTLYFKISSIDFVDNLKVNM